jgi:uncharacterized membrane protein
MYILLVVIVLFTVVYQNGRITKLEHLIKSGKHNLSDGAQKEVSAPVHVMKQDTHEQHQVSTVLPTKMHETETSSSVDIPVVSEEETSGKVLGRIGIAALVLGVAFFIKYAFDHDWISPAGRVMIGILIGAVLVALGQWLRKKYLSYSDLLTGGGMAILYLSIYSSCGYYHLVDPMMAFMGMIVVTAVGVILSMIDATVTLSVVAFIGGFLTPFIIGTGTIDPWIVFIYITILNAGILGILIYKKWSPLIIIGLIGTWMYFGWWFVSSYKEALLVPTLIFLLVQYLIFTASSVIHIVVEKIKATEIDYFVLGTTAISFAGMCYTLLMPEYKHYVSLGAVMVAVFYMVIALLAYKANPEDRSINVFLPGLGVSFLTIAVPIEFSGPWIAAWWFIESLVIYIVASTSSSRGFQVMGVMVYIFGLLDLFYYIATYNQPANYQIFFNAPFIMLVMAIGVAYIIAFTYYRYGSVSEEIQKRGVMVFVVVANFLTVYAISSQIIAYYNLPQAIADQSYAYQSKVQNLSNTSVSIFWALYAALLTIIGFAKKYAAVRRMGLILFIITAFKVVVDVWSLGELYRIISFIVFGIIALVASFIYVRFKDRLKDIV